jgi:hypothetical protein
MRTATWRSGKPSPPSRRPRSWHSVRSDEAVVGESTVVDERRRDRRARALLAYWPVSAAAATC